MRFAADDGDEVIGNSGFRCRDVSGGERTASTAEISGGNGCWFSAVTLEECVDVEFVDFVR